MCVGFLFICLSVSLFFSCNYLFACMQIICDVYVFVFYCYFDLLLLFCLLSLIIHNVHVSVCVSYICLTMIFTNKQKEKSFIFLSAEKSSRMISQKKNAIFLRFFYLIPKKKRKIFSCLCSLFCDVLHFFFFLFVLIIVV